MKIVIIGAGIAGCAAYLELHKHLPSSDSEANHEITIYEAYSTDVNVTADQRDEGEGNTHSSTLIVGGGLGIAPNGLNVLRRLDEDLLRDVVRGGYVVSTSNLKNKNGSTLLCMKPTPNDESGDDPEKMHMVACSRHSFWKALRTRIPDDRIINKKILEVVSHADKRNVIRFVDGSPPVEADLVIGADGIRSTAKRALFPDAEEEPYPPQYEGLVGIGGFIPSAEVKGLVEKGSMNFIHGGNGFFGYFFSESAASEKNRDSPYHVSEPGDSLAWWSTYEIEECPDRDTLDMAAVNRQLQERHAHWKDPVVRKILGSLHVTNMYATWTSPPLPTWERDGVVLVGDAAHALPSTSGQGASQALEDVEAFALLLAHYLGEAGQTQESMSLADQKRAIKAAAAKYMGLREPRVTAILKAAQKMQSNKRDMSVFREYTMYAIMKVMGKNVLRDLSPDNTDTIGIGFFPSLMTGQIRKVMDYNIADDVARVLVAEKGETT
ncbi:hypothetical protein N7474_000431 [Penicillium riverlandense]|uniref:uncharacterized protein n=1 Tax=Penicillium riverlandense TaxID=1903569 RepID=UPI0025488882|nr:uncharacterized protein N7474_000431 [Penicillium riverlandense]KAJ5832120.1 hypothetical protein N7474_000431 [Penicillium riverlandense]